MRRAWVGGGSAGEAGEGGEGGEGHLPNIDVEVRRGGSLNSKKDVNAGPVPRLVGVGALPAPSQVVLGDRTARSGRYAW